MRQRHEEHQPHVGHRGFAVDEGLQAKGEDDCRPKTGATKPQPRSPGQNGDRGQRRRNCRRQPGGECVLSENAVAGDLAPIGERRLVEAVAIVEIRNDVIPALDHFARSLGKSRLIAIDQRQHPATGEMKKQAPAEERDEIACCRLQESDSKMAGAETQPANFSMPQNRAGLEMDAHCRADGDCDRRLISL